MVPKDYRQIARCLPCHKNENITLIKVGALLGCAPHLKLNILL